MATALCTFVVHVEDRPGVLDRVASLFRRRAFNIDSLNVGRTHEPGVSRMTIVAAADRDTALRITANLRKLVNVLDVQEITDKPSVTRTLALLKIDVAPERRAEAMQLAEVFRARVVDVSPSALMLEITGTQDKIDGLVSVLRPFGITEMVQTGVVAMTRGADGTALRDAHPTPGGDVPAA